MLPDLGKNTGYPVKFKFQINKKKYFFSISLCQAISGTYSNTKNYLLFILNLNVTWSPIFELIILFSRSWAPGLPCDSGFLLTFERLPHLVTSFPLFSHQNTQNRLTPFTPLNSIFQSHCGTSVGASLSKMHSSFLYPPNFSHPRRLRTSRISSITFIR